MSDRTLAEVTTATRANICHLQSFVLIPAWVLPDPHLLPEAHHYCQGAVWWASQSPHVVLTPGSWAGRGCQRLHGPRADCQRASFPAKGPEDGLKLAPGSSAYVVMSRVTWSGFDPSFSSAFRFGCGCRQLGGIPPFVFPH